MPINFLSLGGAFDDAGDDSLDNRSANRPTRSLPDSPFTLRERALHLSRRETRFRPSRYLYIRMRMRMRMRAAQRRRRRIAEVDVNRMRRGFRE